MYQHQLIRVGLLMPDLSAVRLIDPTTNFVAGVAATFVPLFVGLFLPPVISGNSIRRLKMLMAVSAGIIFWFFLDVMNDAVLLDVNQGFGGGLDHAILAALFAIGLLSLFGLEQAYSRSSADKARGEKRISTTEISYAIAVLVALGIGFHALGEGIEIGSLVPTATNMLDAIGGFSAGVAYVLHKFLEGFVIGSVAAFAKVKTPRILILGLVSGIPTIIGSSLALLTPINSAYFFALGGAAAVYVEYKLIPNFVDQESAPIYVIASLIGFYSMYLAGLFHG
jgi:zinc transporter ZupT